MNYKDILETAIPQLTNEGREVILPVDGRSMLPFIVGGRDSLVLIKKYDRLNVGEIVLAMTKEAGYVIHRIDSISDDGEYSLLGDGNLERREHCGYEDIKAVAVAVVKPGGKRVPLQNNWHKFTAKTWRVLLPVRRYLLWIYRKTHNLPK